MTTNEIKRESSAKSRRNAPAKRRALIAEYEGRARRLMMQAFEMEYEAARLLAKAAAL